MKKYFVGWAKAVVFLRSTCPLLFLCLFSVVGWAESAAVLTDDVSTKLFQDKTGCFILYNLNENKTITEYNAPRCAERIPPNSTFKVPLMLMAFDQKLIDQQTIFKWDGKKHELEAWNHCQTPKTWMKNSALWVSQLLTPQLGLKKIQHYLKVFHYGNEDFSAGLTTAWLSRSPKSLKISANEQLTFLKALVNNTLPVSSDAMSNTKENIFLETTKSGWKLYGKTGAGYHNVKDRENNVPFGDAPQDGWFIGFMQKNKQTYVFVLNFSDHAKPNSTVSGGVRAKAMTQELLEKMSIM